MARHARRVVAADRRNSSSRRRDRARGLGSTRGSAARDAGARAMMPAATSSITTAATCADSRSVRRGRTARRAAADPSLRRRSPPAAVAVQRPARGQTTRRRSGGTMTREGRGTAASGCELQRQRLRALSSAISGLRHPGGRQVFPRRPPRAGEHEAFRHELPDDAQERLAPSDRRTCNLTPARGGTREEGRLPTLAQAKQEHEQRGPRRAARKTPTPSPFRIG